MMKELDTAILTVDLPQYGLTAGDLGAVVLVNGEGDDVEYLIEFLTLEGDQIGVVPLDASQVRPAKHEVAHARAL